MVCSSNPIQDIGQDKPSIKQYLTHRIREFAVLFSHILNKNNGRVVVFASSSLNKASGLLWGRGALAEMRTLGWDVVLMPPQLELCQRQRLCKILKPDVIVFIKARVWKNHPIHFSQYPSVFILDDADYLVPAEGEHIIQCLKGASGVVAANEHVATWCRQYNSEITKVWVPHPPRKQAVELSNSRRENIIMWAPASPESYPIEAEYVSQIISKLQRLRNDFEFWMTGCQDKQWANRFAQPLNDAGVKIKQFGYFAKYQEYLNTIAQAPIGLHPIKLNNPYAHGKSFGKILSYIASSTTVITDTVPDHSDFFNHSSNGMLADSVDEYVESISYLLDHPQERQAMADQAYLDFLEQLATPIAAKKLETVILKAIQSAPKNYP